VEKESKMKDQIKLDEKTEIFFKRHWGFEGCYPIWNHSWDWCGSVPNYLKCGVYALFRSDELIYIGLGNSHGSGNHTERGISRRLGSHVFKIAPAGSVVSYICREKWDKLGVTRISTLGFDEGKSYLSPSLEDYLIERLDPIENINQRRSKP